MSTTSRYAELFSNFGFKNDRLLDGFEKKHQRKWQNIEGRVYYYTTTKDSFFLQSVLHTDSTTTGKRKSFPNEIKIYGLASFTFFFFCVVV